MVVKFEPGPAKLQVVKALKEELHLKLKEAKDLVDNGEFICNEEQFPAVKKALADQGARDFFVKVV